MKTQQARHAPVLVVGHAVDHVLAARTEALRVLAVHLQEHLGSGKVCSVVYSQVSEWCVLISIC